jgi:hypothetical protein
MPPNNALDGQMTCSVAKKKGMTQQRLVAMLVGGPFFTFPSLAANDSFDLHSCEHDEGAFPR